jgi:serine/threonine protein kinase
MPKQDSGRQFQKSQGREITHKINFEVRDELRLSNFFEILEDLGLDPKLRGPWAAVGNTDRVQGWKLHVSSIPTEAVDLVHLIVPTLVRNEVCFKIAKDQSTLMQLNEGALGPTQIGKFMTIYPQQDADIKNLATELVRTTKGWHGPVVVTDLRLGDIIYARYGGFNPIISLDRLGQTFRLIYSPDGSLRDDTYHVPFTPPEGVQNPFAGQPEFTQIGRYIDELPTSEKSTKLFGPGYLILEILKQHPKGSVFRCLDLRSQEQIGIKIIKQGKQYCLADIYDRDMRTRLQRQEVLFRILNDSVPIPKIDSYFEVDGDGYLTIEDIEGQSIESFVVQTLKNRPWRMLCATEMSQLLSVLERTLIAVQKLHAQGYVHRDLTASNIWITRDENVFLLDLELAHAVNDTSPPIGLGTPGFMSPEQVSRSHPGFEDDIYALGCVMILLFTGLDPRRILFAADWQRTNQFHGLMASLPEDLIDIIVRCVKTKASDRPSLEDVKAVIQNYKNSISFGRPPKLPVASITPKAVRTNKFGQYRIDDLIRKGLRGLLNETIMDNVEGVWLSPVAESKTHLNIIEPSVSYEPRRSANRGVGGVVYILGRLARCEYTSTAVQQKVKNAISWLTRNRMTSDSLLPGLHFGQAGVAVALVEAIKGKLVNRNEDLLSYISDALSGELDWPDLTHGAAGQGIATLYCADLIQKPTFLKFAHRCADYLIQNQKKDGSWEMPPGAEGISGETLTGFAHGVSGIVYFLAEYDRRFDSKKACNAWQSGVEWITKQAIPGDGGKYLEWPYSDQKKKRWKWWCHGSPGIALLFLRLYEQTKSPEYAEIATKALQVHPTDILYPNLTLCHGLSGLGEIYLEAARVLGEHSWLDRAQKVANTLFQLRHETKNGSVIWLAEDPHNATADLMVGAGGVLHFFLRLSLFPSKLGFPLLLDPLNNMRT